jgi:methylase of polypeptide subunit release factors
LIRSSKKNPAAMLCPVWVYPADGFVVTSDRRDDPEGEPYAPPADVVFPAIYGGTLRFLRLLGDTRGGTALDLCGGCGIGALHFSRNARTVASVDLAERSALFTAFNALVNGVCLESLCGDLYEPVPGRQFDLISAHPPFVPATGPTMVYRDGGDTGEEVTRRIVEGLPAHLNPGGTCVILCVARDVGDKLFEQRAGDWLGEKKNQFDVVFGLEKVLSVAEVVESMRKRGQQLGEEEARQLLARLQSFGTRQFVYGALVLRRYAEPVHREPSRVHLTPDGMGADFERLLAWRNHCQQPGFPEWLLNSRPRLAPRLELTVRHGMRDGTLVPIEFVFSVVEGFQAALRLDGWVVPLIARLEGTMSIREVFDAAHTAGELPAGFTQEAFVELIQKMVERGFLQLELPTESKGPN